jgi:hypothetical protein
MSEIDESLESRDFAEEIAKVIPEEQDSYFQSIHAKHFVPETAVGSLFTEAKDLNGLLREAARQRGDLEGDDREEFINMGVPTEALMPQCRYIKVNTPGEVGIVKIADLSPDTEVKVERKKPNTPCALIVEQAQLPEVDFGTIIIGPNEKENPDDPEPSTAEMVWTVHPGIPIRPASEDIWAENSTATVKEVMDRLGDKVYLQVEKKITAISPNQ